MKAFWFYFRAFWHGFFYPFESPEKREEYADKEAVRFLRGSVKSRMR